MSEEMKYCEGKVKRTACVAKRFRSVWSLYKPNPIPSVKCIRTIQLG